MVKGRIPTCLWRSETLQLPRSPESQKVAVSRGRKQGTYSDSEGIQPPELKVSEIVRMDKFEEGPRLSQGAMWASFSHSGGLQWVLWETWGSTVKVPGEVTRWVCSETSVSEKGACEWRNSQTLRVSVSSRKAFQERALSNCFLRLWRRRQQQ